MAVEAGIEVCYGTDGLILSQQKYIHELLQRSGFEWVKGLPTPMVASCRLFTSEGTPISNVVQYRNIAPRVVYFQAVKRILRYLQGSIDYGLKFTPSRLSLTRFVDANWGPDVDDRQSTSSFCIFFGGNLVSWSSHKQQVVARSTARIQECHLRSY
ncbi:uncharacterized mitochondrial protein AtMg00810-like [Hibiscus syriacus]|uniref:uncharacterized mitochondrial protein AtMg00810-like n=1 Tax=Hibiscus syriacus TaxID=106335 RepID=UPI001924AA10|nr:uncharacterized mitochondrial protein AtMg00810-like [Hibiscus syriacus]